MSAAVVAVNTPYLGCRTGSGRVTISDVPDGRYQLNHVWYERSLPEDLKSVSRAVAISESARTLEPIKIIENANFSLEHKNKYGQDTFLPRIPAPSYGGPECLPERNAIKSFRFEAASSWFIYRKGHEKEAAASAQR